MLNIDKRRQMKKIAMTSLAINIARNIIKNRLKYTGLVREIVNLQLIGLAKQQTNAACSIPASVYCIDKPKIDKRRYKRHMRKNTQYIITGKL